MHTISMHNLLQRLSLVNYWFRRQLTLKWYRTLWGRQRLSLANCWFHPPTYFELIYDHVGLTTVCHLPIVGSIPDLLWNNIWPCGVDKTCCLPFLGSVPDLLWNTIWPCRVKKICCLPLVGSVPDLCWNIIWPSKSIECWTQSLCVQQ
jgi:hypothetical protein